MNFINIFVFISIFNGGFCQISDIKSHKVQETDVISTFISKVCEDFFIKKSIKFDVIVYENSTEELDDIKTVVLRSIGQKYPTKSFILPDFDEFFINNSAVILIKDWKSFRKYLKASNLATLNPMETKVVVYIDKEVDSFPDTIGHSDIADLWSVEYWIYHYEDFLTLATYDEFSSQNCRQQKIRELYKFDKIKKKFIKKDQNLKKVHNFNGCPLIVSSEYGRTLFFKKSNMEILKCISWNLHYCNGIINEAAEFEQLQGLAVDIFNILGQIHNFKPEYRIFGWFQSEDYSEDSKLKYPIVHVKMKSIENPQIVISSFLQQISHILVTRSTTLTSSELLLYTFDLISWIVVITSLCVACVVIFVIQLRLGTVRIGPRKELTRPALIVLQIVFGCRQKKLPRANFARFLIILFILLCLVLRICYWCRLVGLMATGVKRVEPKTFGDVIDLNYTIYSCEGTFQLDSKAW